MVKYLLLLLSIYVCQYLIRLCMDFPELEGNSWTFFAKGQKGVNGLDCPGPSTNQLISFKGRNTLQGINISHLGKRKIIFKMPFLGDMLVPSKVLFQQDFPHFFGGLWPCFFWGDSFWSKVWKLSLLLSGGIIICSL